MNQKIDPKLSENRKFMSLMADPMEALLKYQQLLNTGVTVDRREQDEGYLKLYDEPNGGKRYSYVKIIDGEVQALAIFGLENPIDGVVCYSVGYAVKENYRRRGLAVEAVNKGIEDLIKRFRLTNMKSFYVDAVIGITNANSIKVAEKLFPGTGDAIIETYSEKPSLHFKRLIVLR